MTIFPPSKIAIKYVSETMHGIEFGAAAHNPFVLPNCLFADIEFVHQNTDSLHYKHQMEMCGRVQKVDVIAGLGSPIPFDDARFDYVVTSHVLEHIFDLLATFRELDRITKPGGLGIHILPHLDRNYDKGKPPTLFTELHQRFTGGIEVTPDAHHQSFFRLDDFLSAVILSRHLGIHRFRVLEANDVDDKVGNGFITVLQKQ